MSSSISDLSARRMELIARAGAEREALSLYYRQLDRPARKMDSMLAVANFLKSPVVIAAATALLFRTRWRGIARVPKLLWKGWKFLWAVKRYLRR